jgi:hypothetical protein
MNLSNDVEWARHKLISDIQKKLKAMKEITRPYTITASSSTEHFEGYLSALSDISKYLETLK